MPLSKLQPLDGLLDRLASPIYLEDWLKQRFAQGWEPCDRSIKSLSVLSLAGALRSRLQNRRDEIKRRVEQLYLKQANLVASKPAPAIEPEAALVKLMQIAQDDEIRWQAAELLWQLNPQHPACPILSAKDLGLYLKGHKVALMAGILAKADGSRLILLRLYPLEPELHLPPGLKLIGLNETGPLFQVESRQQDDYIQFKFTADLGDRFTIRLVLDDATFNESFVV